MVLNKEVSKGGAKAFGHHHIEASFPMSTRGNAASVKLRVDLELVVQGMSFPFHWLEFNHNILPSQNVVRKIYFICPRNSQTKTIEKFPCTYAWSQTQPCCPTCIYQLIIQVS
jgi:hypothetical protein